MRNILNHSPARYGMTALFLVMAATSLAASQIGDSVEKVSTHSDGGITMTGLCRNGDAFRLVSYEKQVSGLWKSFYDYQGPVGAGTVKTKTVPKVMASRVCVALAEIASDEH
jgi:hypothetical protein